MINRIPTVGLLCSLVFGLEACFLSGGENEPSPARGIGVFRVGDERVFRRVITQVGILDPDARTKQYDIRVKAERLLVQEGSKRMLFRVSRPDFDDSIATDTLIETDDGFKESASADFGLWYPDTSAGLSGTFKDFTTASVVSHGERFVLTWGWSTLSMHMGVTLRSECLADSSRGPLYGLNGYAEAINHTSSYAALTLLSLNGKPIDVDSLRALFPPAL